MRTATEKSRSTEVARMSEDLTTGAQPQLSLQPTVWLDLLPLVTSERIAVYVSGGYVLRDSLRLAETSQKQSKA